MYAALPIGFRQAAWLQTTIVYRNTHSKSADIRKRRKECVRYLQVAIRDLR